MSSVALAGTVTNAPARFAVSPFATLNELGSKLRATVRKVRVSTVWVASWVTVSRSPSDPSISAGAAACERSYVKPVRLVSPAIGAPLAVGRSVGRVVRHFAEGFAVKFERPVDRDYLEHLIIKT